VSVAAVLLSAFAVFLTYLELSKARPLASVLTIDQLCLDWATYVERLERQGLSLEEIDKRGNWFSNLGATTDDIDDPYSITEFCGDADGVLNQRGEPPTESDAP
jgi:hypothetical protein